MVVTLNWGIKGMIGTDKIIDFQDIRNHNLHRGPEETIRSFVSRFWRMVMGSQEKLSNPDRKSSLVGSVKAEIVAGDLPGRIGPCGRWVVRCPSTGCQGAEDVDRSDPVFMCCHCFNRDNDNKWYRVEFPEDRERIEELLLKRPAANRWWSGEAVEEVEAENKDNGVGV